MDSRPGSIDATVAVLGLGPAGRALAHRLRSRGIDTVAVDVVLDRVWRPTYGAWADDVPDWVPTEAVRTRSRPAAFTRRRHELERDYVVFDTAGLQRMLDLGPVRTVEGRVVTADAHHAVLADGRSVRADVVVDARGSAVTPDKAQQTAYGVVVSRARAEAAGGLWFMDWRDDHGAASASTPTFLYAVPLDEDRILLEETCLVGRPALGSAELRRRLETRLAARGVRLTGDEPVEHVRFAVEPEFAPGAAPGTVAGRPAPLRIGARGGLMHPATGYSVAASLTAAEKLAEAIASGVTTTPALHRLLWGRRSRLVRSLRQIGLDTLLSLPPERVPDFFAAFFALPPTLQRSYLSAGRRPVATLAAMAAMAARLPPPLTSIAVRTAGQAVLPHRS